MSASDTRKKRERFLPYAYERFGLELDLLGCELDGADGPQPDREQRVLALDGEPFRRARLRYRVVVPEETLRAALPPSEHGAPPAAVVLVVRCAQTRLRRSVRAMSPPIVALQAECVVDLRREECGSELEIAPFLVRARELSPPEPGYASPREARLAGARPWQVRIQPARAPAGRFLDVRYRSFRQDAWLAAYQHNVYRLECDQDAPVLWINADHDKIAAVLDDRASVGRKARLREVFYDLIAHGVWTQLFMRAVADVRAGEEATYAWQEPVLRQLLPLMFASGRTYPERMRALQQLLDDDVGLLFERLDGALQMKSELGVHMGKLAEDLLERGGA
jgi:hypothetical protein